MAVSSILTSDQITSLIQQASQNYQAPATALQAQEKPIQTQISALGQIQNALSSLQSALSDIGDIQTLSQRNVTTSSGGIVQATATNDAAPGTYVLSNIQLAQSETLLSSGFGSASGSIGTGTLSLAVGTGAPVTLNIASGKDDLTDIAAAINQAQTGVQATVMFDGTTHRLELSGASGAANTFTVSGTGALAALSYAPGASGLTQIQAAANAQFSLNGVTISSGSNTIAGVVTGLTFNLAASGTASVTVTQDVSALGKAADGVVNALNQVLGTINQYASYSPVSGAGPLLGDINVEVLRSQLLSAISAPSTAASSSSSYASLASLGFSVTSSGTIALDDAAFTKAAQSGYADVAALLANAGAATDPRVSVEDAAVAQPGRYSVAVTQNDIGSIIGVVNGQPASGSNGELTVIGNGSAAGLRLHIDAGATGDLGTVTVTPGLFGNLAAVVNSALAAGSGVTGEIDNLNSTITSMNQQIAGIQQRAQRETLVLTQQFSAAQATLSQLTTVSDFLSTYFNQTSGSGG